MGAGERIPAGAGEDWRRNFERHAARERRHRRWMRHVPTDPRCKFCYTPFAGAGRLLRALGRGPSRKNPTLCAICVEEGPAGGFEDEAGVLFADVRGFTALVESLSPREVAELMNRFYGVATSVLLEREAIIDKLVGDEVMAVFWPPLMDGDRPVEEMVGAALELLRGVGYGDENDSWLPLGVGAHFGPAFIGNVGDENVRDFTVLGDVVNTASRLQEVARAGQLVVSEHVYEAARPLLDGAQAVELELRGKSEPFTAFVHDAADAVNERGTSVRQAP